MGAEAPDVTGSDPRLLALHGVRLLGFAPTAAVAARFGLDRDEVAEHLEDFRAAGWVTWSEFAGTGGWALTARGREANERQLGEELAAAGARARVTAVHRAFLPLNARVMRAITDWQTRPSPGRPLASNDHTDWRWDERALRRLSSAGAALRPLCTSLTEALDRFHGYHDRYAAALAEVDRGRRSYVDATDVDSCHTVWFQLHEDLVATLGIPRGEEPADH
jgi:hypothetical protein